MATSTFRIQNYWVFLGSKLLITAGVGQSAAVPAQALIHCVGQGGESLAIFCLNKDRNVANTDSDDWPNGSQISGNSVRGEIYVPADQYQWYLDILRNEDPVFGHVDDAAPHMNRIWCNEPVGEGEYFGN